MMRKTIHAHTETDANHPGYVAISLEENGKISVAVRTRGFARETSIIHLTRDQLENLAQDLVEYLAVPVIKKTGK